MNKYCTRINLIGCFFGSFTALYKNRCAQTKIRIIDQVYGGLFVNESGGFNCFDPTNELAAYGSK